MNPLFLAYSALGGAIVCEVIATTLLQKSEQFSRPLPTGAMVLFYIVSFYLLSQALKGVPLGIAYAVWGGLGIVLTATISVVILKQSLDLPALAGIAMIVTGVIVMNVFSNSVTHG
ncbi:MULTISPECIES: DMT family transporter [Alphaproteobacteria]|uniref:QacE family quaternary ammonium compound efflux SMR transporter n=2 Tax=Alphaproteobacteria TaxID=28211 RepID=A0A512HFG7_9HYPH|nr:MULTISPECIES: multidrug efflux SMR transporter [Alphaproteobacteria]GEO84191.1 QacE family quaternary ammonium compound efflux SMR transporter [Ciceribacter naphthalenivorans]GLR24727.1 QacE family quaternary ammonium compound efflux SMR transporter [Ciceribacter naphthalenivorans]GLT07583.1 QacE family quaternary ammonium compound efflux SMR transporter [Sphingomonas psychrolutea]